MTKLDDAIREALSSDAADKLETLAAPQGLIGLALGPFQSRTSGFMWLNFFLQFAFFFLGIWASWHFYIAETGREMALWGAGAGLGFFIMAILKLWYLLQIDKCEILREIKRLELQLALVAKQSI
jgi:hypothetical protein